MNIELKNHIQFVRENSKYYSKLYKNVPTSNYLISDLPILDQDSYWACNGISDNSVLTSKMPDGVVFKSGGTTGTPKSSYFTQVEWEEFTDDFAFGMDHLNLKAGDRCANLFYSGDMYASFLFS